MKNFYFLMVIIFSCLLFGCSKQDKSLHNVKGMNAFYYILMPSKSLTKDKFEFNKFKIEYFEGRTNDACSGKNLGTDITTAHGTATERFRINLPKSYGYNYRAAAETAYADKFVSAVELYKIQCLRATFYGTQNNINYVSNTADYPVVCGGECPGHCGCLPYGTIEYKKFYFIPFKS